ncbi:MAG TPA: hypothetical protein VK177_05700, partial [Flavobacteriales bacterium]|nr:hypothetical protein [Flavobacteriales bacterium]
MMLKTQCFILFFSLGALSLWGQNAPVEQWVSTVNGLTSGDEAVSCSFRDNAGYTWIAGVNTSGTFVVKFDNTGLVVASKQYVDSNNIALYPKTILADAAGNVYLGGYKYYGYEYYITALKLNSMLEVEWETNYNTAETVIYLESMT